QVIRSVLSLLKKSSEMKDKKGTVGLFLSIIRVFSCLGQWGQTRLIFFRDTVVCQREAGGAVYIEVHIRW
ncbi:MAG: hypothetical protein KAJ90_01730, partial [Desulfobacterales bacterium]|nr:hypothetical protein [Desulfobacterales bacterium]